MQTRKMAAIALLAFSTAASAQYRATSESSVGGFVNPESVGCDVQHKVLYVGNFGAPKLDPAAKEGTGYISKVGLDGKIIEKQWVPVAGGEKMNKPKGIWIRGDRLWVTDIDAVWVFDTRTKKGRKLPLPGVVFANDPAVMGNALYVSDNRSDQLVKIEPADFLNAKAPKITQVFKGAGVFPNGVYPMRDGMLLMVGFVGPDKPQPIWALGVSGQLKKLSEPIGRLDGAYEMPDGSLLLTDWDSGSVFLRSESDERRKVADGFKGPADLCVMPQSGGLTPYIPNLVQSQVRIVQLRK